MNWYEPSNENGCVEHPNKDRFDSSYAEVSACANELQGQISNSVSVSDTPSYTFVKAFVFIFGWMLKKRSRDCAFRHLCVSLLHCLWGAVFLEKSRMENEGTAVEQWDDKLGFIC
jgi:hypothetical protein